METATMDQSDTPERPLCEIAEHETLPKIYVCLKKGCHLPLDFLCPMCVMEQHGNHRHMCLPIQVCNSEFKKSRNFFQQQAFTTGHALIERAKEIKEAIRAAILRSLQKFDEAMNRGIDKFSQQLTILEDQNQLQIKEEMFYQQSAIMERIELWREVFQISADEWRLDFDSIRQQVSQFCEQMKVTRFLLANIWDALEKHGSCKWDSSILVERKAKETVERWIPSLLLSPKLIYKASIDGNNSEAFHKAGDGKAPTLTLMKTSHGKVIGGYTPLAWTSDDQVLEDQTNSTFLFSVEQGKEFFPKCQKAVIRNNRNNGPAFGSDTSERDRWFLTTKGRFSVNEQSSIIQADITSEELKIGGGKTFSILEMEIYQLGA